MKVYLVDFENVKSKGLAGVDSLTENDSVIIFYSENSDTISFEMHQKVLSSKAEVEYFKVNVGGKNALDFQLSTLLGYLVGKNAYSHIFVISNDRGFDFLHDFWHGKYVASPSCVVYRTRTITAALNYAKLNETDSEETIEIPNEAPEVVSEATAEVEVTEEDSVHTSQDEVTEEQVEEIAVEAAVQPIEEEPETVTEEIVSAENTEAVEAVQTEAPEETAQTEPEHTEQKKSKTAVAGYRENVKYALKKAKCKDKTVDEIAQMIATSTTKEELHNLLAKSYKSEATDLYKLIRPKYLRLKALYDEENPAVETAEAENTEVSEAAVATEEAVPTVEAVTEQETAEAPESKVIYTDTISVRLAELLVDKCTDEELVRVRSVFDSAVTKQQLYIRMVKEFRKEKGCEIYNAIRSEYTNLRKQAENTEVL